MCNTRIWLEASWYTQQSSQLLLKSKPPTPIFTFYDTITTHSINVTPFRNTVRGTASTTKAQVFSVIQSCNEGERAVS